MPMFEVPANWRMFGSYYIEANNLREAINKVGGPLPLPSERDYIDDSLIVDEIDEVYAANDMAVPELSKEKIIEELDKRTDPRVEITECFDPATARYRIDDLIGILRDYYDVKYDF